MNRIQLTSQTPGHVEITKCYASTSLKAQLLTASAKNWFLQGRLDTNLRKVLIDVHDRPAIRFEAKLARLSSKTNNTQYTKTEIFC